MAQEKKRYRLIKGTHQVPNPEYKHDPDGGAGASGSHYLAKVGDVVELNDSQFKAFKDKFRPIESEASSVRDEDAEELEAAKLLAMQTGETQNPNPRSR